MKDLLKIIEAARIVDASDIHITTNRPASCRVQGLLYKLDNENLTNEDIAEMIKPFLEKEQVRETFEKYGEVDFAYTINKKRFRINLFKHAGEYAFVMRQFPDMIPDPEDIGLTETIVNFTKLKRGLVLITGETGAGKTTTLASLLNVINQTQYKHIVTLEDPIEYVHPHINSIVNQREIGRDSLTFANGLRAALREDPDIIFVGEMRDLDTITTALTAAETGHMVYSTLHTNTAATTIDRIIDAFPANQQNQIRIQLSNVLKGIVCQQLIPCRQGGRVAAYEIMVNNNAMKSLIRAGKTFQITANIETGIRYGMQTMDEALKQLFESKKITGEDAVMAAIDKDEMAKICMI